MTSGTSHVFHCCTEMLFRLRSNRFDCLPCGNRIPESLPCLHDKVLAAAAEAAISFSTDQRRKQVSISFLISLSDITDAVHFGFTWNTSVQNPAGGILGGFIKGMKGKGEESAKMRESFTAQTPNEHLESIFLKDSFDGPSIPNLDDPIEELSIGSLSPSSCILKQAFI